MITVDTTARVRRAYFVQKRKACPGPRSGVKAIARELKLARNTVRDIVRAGGVDAERPRQMVLSASSMTEIDVSLGWGHESVHYV